MLHNAVSSGSGSIAAFWLELGVRDMESFSDLYAHKRDKPPKIAHSPQRESYSPQKT